jgi:hypothetical protein
MAIGAGLGVVRHVGIPLGVNEGVSPNSDYYAHGYREHDPGDRLLAHQNIPSSKKATALILPS